MSKKFYYLDASGFVTEADAFESVDYVNSSAGVTDAGKPVVLDASGKFDPSLINFGTIDHGSIDGLLDDDHTQYILVDGTRAFTGPQSLGGFKLTSVADGTATNDAVNYGQLQSVIDQIANLEFQDSVIDEVTAPPGSPSNGDRYLVIATATGDFAGQEDKIAVYNGSSWDFITPTVGFFLSVDDLSDRLKYYTGSVWVDKYFEATTASLGVKKVGLDVQLDYVAGGGLELVGNQAQVNVADIVDGSTIEEDGSGNAAISFSTLYNDLKAVSAQDLSSNTTGKGASIIGIEDAGGYTDETDVEGSLQEIYEKLKNFGTAYTVGTGGVTIGNLVYISSNDTVLPYTDITVGNRGIGLALSTEAAASTVRVLANDTILENVLSGATAGTVYYWNGTALTSTIPSTSGQYVWRVGVAKNATDLHVEIEFVKKNA